MRAHKHEAPAESINGAAPGPCAAASAWFKAVKRPNDCVMMTLDEPLARRLAIFKRPFTDCTSRRTGRGRAAAASDSGPGPNSVAGSI